MKNKILINLLVGLVISITLIVLNILVIKPNFTYLTTYNKGVYKSKDNITFRLVREDDTSSYENEMITYKKQDEKMHISVPTKTYENNKMVYTEKTGEVLIAHDGKVINGTYINGTIGTEGLSYDEVIILMNYTTLLEVKEIDNDKINVTSQKIICSILSVFIGFILSFLAYPVILFDKFKTNQKLAILSIGLTLVLCLSSAFYIYFTLK